MFGYRSTSFRHPFHGRADTTVPFRTAEIFSLKARKLGVRCDLAAYEDQGHGFFNYGRGGSKMFRETVKAMDHFLQSLGYLQGEDKVDVFLGKKN